MEDFLKTDQKEPLLLRRVRTIPFETGIVANMTVVTTQGATPEMGDQQTDQTAPRND